MYVFISFRTDGIECDVWSLEKINIIHQQIKQKNYTISKMDIRASEAGERSYLNRFRRQAFRAI